MEGYPPIAEHGLVGDLQTAALVTTDGTRPGRRAPSPRRARRRRGAASPGAPRRAQAFTHLSLINAAINLDDQLDHGASADPVVQRGLR
jgi:hypothetical protein